MNLEQTTDLYASILRQLLPVGGYDPSPSTEALSVDVYAHAKLLAQADLDAKRLLNVLEAIPPELINEYEAEYGLPLKCTVNASRTVEERLQILNWVRTSRNVLNRAYLEQLLAIFGVTLIDIQKFKPIRCTSSCIDPVNTEQLRYKVFLRLQYPMNADMNCIVENYLPGYLRIEWMVDIPWGEWILNSAVTINTIGIAYYTAYKTNQREYYDSYANLDLTAAVIHSLHDADMQQWQAVKDAINELTGVIDWVFDPAQSSIRYKEAITPIDCGSTGSSCPTAQYLFQSTAFPNVTLPYVWDINFANKACTTHKSPSSGPFVRVMNFTTWYNPSFECKYDGGLSIVTWGRIENPSYNPAAAPIDERSIPFTVIAQKIISNASSSNQGISLMAETYLENVANSIFNSESSKQFVKLSDLLSQFELNKTLRT